jgi:rhodanese-related sulfurtransferase
MDTTKPSSHSSSRSASFSCPPADLAAQRDASDGPLLIDVRKNEAFVASEHTLSGALRRDPLQVDAWAGTLPPATSVLVYCIHGHEVSQSTVTALRQRGINAQFLQGGIEAWREQGLPLTAKAAGSATRWVTRERPKIDRIACPWLVRRFVDDQAQFLYVPTDQVAAVAQREVAMAYDVGPQVASTRFTHEGELCSFDAFIKIFHLGADTALAKLADIVRGADTDRLDLAPQCAGLLAVSLGMSRNMGDDHAMLDAMLPAYDALYAWCRDAVAGTDEKHNWKPA